MEGDGIQGSIRQATNARWCRALLIGVMAALGSACASTGRPQQSAFDGQLRDTLLALDAAGDADSLAAAAELTFGAKTTAARRSKLLARAAALAPTRADLVWLQIAACTSISSCDPTPLATTLHVLDPENGAAWAPLLDLAIRRGDAVAADKYVNAIAHSRRFDIYWNTSVARLTAAVIKTHRMEPATALITIYGVEAAWAIPPFQNIGKACSAPAVAEPGRLDTCRNIATAMRDGDTYIAEMMGIDIEKQVWPSGSAEYNEALAARRLAQYRMRTAGAISARSLRTNAHALEYIRLLKTNRTEQELMLAVIAGAGKSPIPPANWKESVP